MNVVLYGEKLKHKKNCNFLPNLLKLIKFESIVQIDDVHKIFDNFSSAVIPFNNQAIGLVSFISRINSKEHLK